jgi:hypothetical protein
MAADVGCADDLLCQSISLLVAGVRAGFLRPVATQQSFEFFAKGDWASFLGNAVGADWEPLTLPDEIKNRGIQSALLLTSQYAGISLSKIEALVHRNEKWSDRHPDEYPIYEYYRKLNVQAVETLAATHSGSRSHLINLAQLLTT